MFKIQRISIRDANTLGNHAAIVTVMVQIETKNFNKLCAIVRHKKSLYNAKPVRDLGNLVLDVGNRVYNMNSNIPAYYPSIDPQGSKRAVKGVKTLEFNYYVKSAEQAEKLGLEVHNLKDGKYVKYSQYKTLYDCNDNVSEIKVA